MLVKIGSENGFTRDEKGVNWGSLRIDEGDDELISALNQVSTVENVCCNARDDRGCVERDVSKNWL